LSTPSPLKSTTDRTSSGFPWFARRLLGIASRIAPGTTSSWAARRFLTPRRMSLGSVAAAVSPGLADASFEVAGVRIAAERWGDPGSPRRVLLVHGWEGSSRQLLPLAAFLASRGYQGLLFDFPAHGRSAGRQTNFVEMSAVVSAAAKRLGEAHRDETGVPPAILAHSAGCVASLLARARGLEVDRMILIASAAELGSFGDSFATALGLSRNVRRRLQEKTERRIGWTWEEITPLRLARALPPTPALILHDEDDREVAPEHGIRLAAALAGSELEITSTLGHKRILRDPGVHRRALEFLGGALTSSPQAKPEIAAAG
jgi:pimeloyl-ACP methyl ester carboxylesterase